MNDALAAIGIGLLCLVVCTVAVAASFVLYLAMWCLAEGARWAVLRAVLFIFGGA